jgi:hypothetical protein
LQIFINIILNSIFDEFLKEGWALKENQKFGNKGGGTKFSKKIITILQGFFHAGNIDKSDRYNAQSMYSELLKMAEENEISQESIPKVESIQSWITRYSAACKTESSKNALNNNNNE